MCCEHERSLVSLGLDGLVMAFIFWSIDIMYMRFGIVPLNYWRFIHKECLRYFEISDENFMDNFFCAK